MNKGKIASQCICNNASLNLYEIEHGIDIRVLVGINDDEPTWCDITEKFAEDDGSIENVFKFGEIEFSLDEFMKVV